MKIRHIENFTIDIDEEYITDLLVKKVLDENYDLKYSKFSNRSVQFVLDEDGKIYCKMVFDRIKRNDYDKEAESEAS